MRLSSATKLKIQTKYEIRDQSQSSSKEDFHLTEIAALKRRHAFLTLEHNFSRELPKKFNSLS
jgi:hypothetical protein